MENALVTVFDSQSLARDASRALQVLSDASTIGLNAGTIITKSAGGGITVIGAHGPEHDGTLGATADALDSKVDDFLADVERPLAWRWWEACAGDPGKSALVAQIDEEETCHLGSGADHRVPGRRCHAIQ
jgi:hypothetical protein